MRFQKIPFMALVTHIKTLFAGFLLFLICSPAALAQLDHGSFVGTITDGTGAGVPQATVQVTNIDTGIHVAVTTDATGRYEASALQPGNYKIEASASGFSRAIADNITLPVGGRQRLDLTLKVGNTDTTIEVSDVALQVETESSQRSQGITNYQSAALPLVTRNYADLLGLVTGVRATTDAAPRANTSSLVRAGSFSVNGQRSVMNNFLLDGVDNNAYSASNQGFDNQIITPPPDSVAQFSVITNSMNAEYGRGPGAAVNVATRGGTNRFHATVYEFIRNTNLNAIGYFAPTGGTKPQFNRNQFGANFGGPLIKDRLFYFVDYEGFRQVVSPVAFASLPTAKERQGILGVDVQDPYNGAIYTRGTSILNSPNISPVSLQVISYLNSLVPIDPSITSTTNSYRGTSRFTDNSDKGSLRLDWQASKKDSLFARISDRKENAVNFPTLPLPLDGGSNGVQRILDQQIVLGWTHTISANQLLDVRLGLDRTKAGKASLSIGDTSFNIPGRPTNPVVFGGLPTMSISGGFSTLGRQSTNPQWQNPAIFDPKVNYSYLHGKHSLKFGYEFERLWMAVQNTDPLGGSFSFGGGFSKCVKSVAGCTSTSAAQDTYWADFLFGVSSQYALSSYFIAYLRQNMHNFYVQDDWKVSPKLTLNLGVRWEYGSPYYDRDNRVTNFDPSTATLLHAKNGSVYDRTLIDPDLNDWAPRIGFAYSVDERTSIRGGYGVGYVHYTRAGPGVLLAINAPQAISVSVAQSPGSASYRRLQEGFPTGLTDTFDPLKTTIIYMPRHTRDSYVHSYYLSVQRQLMKNTLLDIAYVGNHGLKLQTIGNYNQRDPKNNFARPIPTWSEITNPRNAGYSNYNSLQVRYEQRFLSGLTLLNSFTWGKSMDNDSASQDSNGPSPQDANNPAAEYAQSDYNQPVIDSLSLVYELPFGYGKTFLAQSGRILNQFVGGWQISAINQFASGTPFNVTYSPPSAYQVSPGLTATNRGANQYRPNRVSGQPLVKRTQNGSTIQWVNLAAVTIPNTTATTPIPFGNIGRNPGLGPSYYNTDFALNKTFGARDEGLKVQFRTEAYNLFNHTNFVSPTNSSMSGTIGGNPTSGGTLSSTFPSRILQFGLKVIY